MAYKNVRSGWYTRADNRKIWCRSSWEKDYSAYLDWLVSLGEIKGWEYEPEEFEFHAIKRGTRFYKPDFRVVDNNGDVEYHEVKGRWTAKAKTQVKRFRKYYPQHKLVIIDADVYNAIKRQKALIPGWE